MIWLDVTNSGSARHRSGLTRVTTRLQEELAANSTASRWGEGLRRAAPGDWYLTAELFCERERPGLVQLLDHRPCRLAAIFHDAIPLRFPDITWPQSVARHPEYLKLLARFDRIWAVSAASRDDLLKFWHWQGIEAPPPVELLELGANFGAGFRPAVPAVPQRPPALLAVGILEPRKNQEFLLEICEELWAEGAAFALHLVGRSNPHFGGPILSRIKSMARGRPGLHYHGAASDAEMSDLYRAARASVFPTIAEGCGLPVLESLWLGVPCICSDLPALRENMGQGGCVALPVGDRTAWKAALRRILYDDSWQGDLAAAARVRTLPTWAAAAAVLRQALAAA